MTITRRTTTVSCDEAPPRMGDHRMESHGGVRRHLGHGVAAGSLALTTFGLSSIIEVFASSVVIWHLREGRDPAPHRTRLAFKLIAIAFFALALFLFITSVRSLVLGLQPGGSPAAAHTSH